MLPFLPGAFFLGTVFLKAQRSFGRIYFADLTGSGLCGLLVLAAVAVVPPEHLLLVPLLLWLAGSGLWFMARRPYARGCLGRRSGGLCRGAPGGT